MVTVVNLDVAEYRGLSTDTKPDGNVANGSSYYEMDTGATYYYDADSSQWTIAPDE